jgi:HEAT repeat protein
MNWKVWIIMMAAGMLAGGCFAPDPISITSDSPASAIPAIKQAADRNDRTAIPRLIEDLNDPDSAIRFAAIQALEKMTGQTLGYRYYDDEVQRRPAVQRWRQWLKDQPFQ